MAALNRSMSKLASDDNDPLAQRAELLVPTLGFVHNAYGGPLQLDKDRPWDVFRNYNAGLFELDRYFGYVRSKIATHWFALRAIRGYSPGSVRREICTTYETINRMYANGNKNALKEFVAEVLCNKMASEIDKRKAAGIHRVEWKLTRPLTRGDVKIVHGVRKKLEKMSSVSFVQLTFRITSEQEFAAYDSKVRWWQAHRASLNRWWTTGCLSARW